MLTSIKTQCSSVIYPAQKLLLADWDISLSQVIWHTYCIRHQLLSKSQKKRRKRVQTKSQQENPRSPSWNKHEGRSIHCIHTRPPCYELSSAFLKSVLINTTPLIRIGLAKLCFCTNYFPLFIHIVERQKKKKKGQREKETVKRQVKRQIGGLEIIRQSGRCVVNRWDFVVFAKKLKIKKRQ